MILPPPRSTRPYTPFPPMTLVRSAIRAAAGNALAGARERTAAGPIECVTHACRAVGDEVVVAIFGVLGPSIPFEISDQFTALRGVEIKLLQIDPATLGGLEAQRAVERLHVDPVVHATAREVQEEILLIEIEHAVVVELRVRLGRITDPEIGRAHD